MVINTPGTFITQKDEYIRLKQKEKAFDISPLRVESIVITNQAMNKHLDETIRYHRKKCQKAAYPSA